MARSARATQLTAPALAVAAAFAFRLSLALLVLMQSSLPPDFDEMVVDRGGLSEDIES